MTSAIFLDRDGTINEQAAPHQHVTSPEHFHFLPGVLDALAFLAQNSERKIVLVTNQSCIARNTATREQVRTLNEWMEEQIHQVGGRLDGIYVCPHAPWDSCTCRKPKPGLIQRAARRLDLDLEQSVMIGDSPSDLHAGWAAGVKDCYLVMTGPRTTFPRNCPPYESCAYLADAARAIVEVERG